MKWTKEIALSAIWMAQAAYEATEGRLPEIEYSIKQATENRFEVTCTYISDYEREYINDGSVQDSEVFSETWFDIIDSDGYGDLFKTCRDTFEIIAKNTNY